MIGHGIASAREVVEQDRRAHQRRRENPPVDPAPLVVAGEQLDLARQRVVEDRLCQACHEAPAAEPGDLQAFGGDGAGDLGAGLAFGSGDDATAFDGAVDEPSTVGLGEPLAASTDK